MNKQLLKKELLRSTINLTLFFSVLLFSILLLIFRNLKVAVTYSSLVACCTFVKGFIAACFNFKLQQQGKLIYVKIVVPAVLVSYVIVVIADRLLWILFTGQELPDFKTSNGIGTWLGSVFQAITIHTMIVYLFKNRIHEREKSNIQLEHERLKTVRAKAELLLLKQQIQPHFLFNSLNTLKILYKTDIDKADLYVENLSAFLRSSINEHEKDIATIGEEVKMVDNYMKMQRIRFGDAIQYHVEISNDTRNRCLPSFTLQPLIENAIKHNAALLSSPLHISIVEHGSRLIVSNNVQPRFTNEVSSGKGLNNLTARYRLLAMDEIIVKNEHQIFSVSVKILENEDIDH